MGGQAKQQFMKRVPATFLQAVTVLMGLSVFVFLLWEPHLEGRNVNATLFEMYFTDPFLAYVYIATIPFFIALYQVLKVLSYASNQQAFSPSTIKAVQTIKHCALIIVGFVLGAQLWIVLTPSDDRAGGIALSTFVAFASIVIAAGAAVFEQILQGTEAMKTDNK